MYIIIYFFSRIVYIMGKGEPVRCIPEPSSAALKTRGVSRCKWFAAVLVLLVGDLAEVSRPPRP